ncbi:hypothetical protein EI94DRAFT_1699010 [Lactarius quietus]|nr:hypothetical protein EI94DRAFT_1699010 [Lactarius quietus]
MYSLIAAGPDSERRRIRSVFFPRQFVVCLKKGAAAAFPFVIAIKHGLALARNAPAVFGRMTRNGLPCCSVTLDHIRVPCIHGCQCWFEQGVWLFSSWDGVFLKDNRNTATFVTNCLPLILFPILYIGAK